MKPFASIALSCVLMGLTGMLSAEPPERLVYLGSSFVYDKEGGSENRLVFPLTEQQGNSGL